MAYYQNPELMGQFYHSQFDMVLDAGQRTPWSGIYRCEGCGREITHTADKPLPGHDHHRHTFLQGWVRWRLVVADSSALADSA